MDNILVLDGMESATGWTALSSDTEGLTASTTHAWGTNALQFDKVNGGANTVFGAIYRTVALNLQHQHQWNPDDRICWLVNLSALTDVAYSFVRLGTDASNYAEWRFTDTSHTAARFTLCSENLGNCYVTGNGCIWSNIDYMVIGVAFDGEDDTLANIEVDQIYLRSSVFTQT